VASTRATHAAARQRFQAAIWPAINPDPNDLRIRTSHYAAEVARAAGVRFGEVRPQWAAAPCSKPTVRGATQEEHESGRGHPRRPAKSHLSLTYAVKDDHYYATGVFGKSGVR
jgi:hypothetical protein